MIDAGKARLSMDPGSTLGTQAAALREAFDASFAEPARIRERERLAFVLVRMSGELLAVRGEELSGVVRAEGLAALPPGRAGRIGLAAHRGRLLAVWDLAAFLGLGAGKAGEGTGSAWLLLCGEGGRVGLAVDGFEGWRRAAPEALSPADAGKGARPYVRAVLRDDETIPVLDLGSVLDELMQRAGAAGENRKGDPRG